MLEMTKIQHGATQECKWEAFMLTLLGGPLGLTLKLSYAHSTSSHSSRQLSYILST